jgi:hypothetical protein
VCVASLATQSLNIAYGCSPSRFKLYFVLLHWAFKTFFTSIFKTTACLLSLSWFFFTACLALYSEFFPHSDAYILGLFALFATHGIPPVLSMWGLHWWNVEIFLQWFVPKLLWLLTLDLVLDFC